MYSKIIFSKYDLLSVSSQLSQQESSSSVLLSSKWVKRYCLLQLVNFVKSLTASVTFAPLRLLECFITIEYDCSPSLPALPTICTQASRSQGIPQCMTYLMSGISSPGIKKRCIVVRSCLSLSAKSINPDSSSGFGRLENNVILLCHLFGTENENPHVNLNVQ